MWCSATRQTTPDGSPRPPPTSRTRPKSIAKVAFFSDLSWVAFPLKTLSKWNSGKKWNACGVLQQTGLFYWHTEISDRDLLHFTLEGASDGLRFSPTPPKYLVGTLRGMWCSATRRTTPDGVLGRRRRRGRARNRSTFHHFGATCHDSRFH